VIFLRESTASGGKAEPVARKTQSALVDEAPEFHPVKPPLVPQNLGVLARFSPKNHWVGGFRSLETMIHWRFLEVASPVDHSGRWIYTNLYISILPENGSCLKTMQKSMCLRLGHKILHYFFDTQYNLL